MAASNKHQRMHHLNRHDIIELININNIDLLKKVTQTNFGFDRFLKRRDYFKSRDAIDYELVELLVEISSRICAIRLQSRLGSLLKFLSILATDCKEFVFTDAFNVINDCLDHKGKICFASYLKHYVIILKTMMKEDIAAETIVNYTYPSLQNVFNHLKALKIQNLQEAEDEYAKLKREVDKYERPSPGSDEDDDEAGLFRQLSVVPKNDDIVNVILPDIPCNKIDGPYSSVNQYLSVHFRLMREDMIRSFRDCVKMCENPSEAAKSGCRIYESVKVEFPPQYVPDGICYKIQVQTNKVIDLTTVLKPGSMVCLTPDSFQTVYFAILIKSPKGPGKTKQCTTEIRLDEVFDNVLKTDVEYLMFEPNAYFECYKHVLSAIKEFDKNNLPLADFLAFLDFDNPEPEYLACPEIFKNQKYCLHEKCDKIAKKSNYVNSRILEKKLCSDNESVQVNAEVSNTELKLKNDEFDNLEKINSFEEDLEYVNESNVSDECKVFNPLCFDEWPSATELELDDQQLEAFKIALTKKIAVIQGPPGTGKTFMGVKMVNAFLYNVPMKPIIVCCLTNHALDQFLERILKFNEKVIRLGHQSESSLLEHHNLDNLFMACKQRFDKNSHLTMDGLIKKSLNLLQVLNPQLSNMHSGDYDENFVHLQFVCKKLNNLFNSLNLCKEKYLDDGILNEMISDHNKKQLREGSSNHSRVLSFNVLEWLCCSRTSELYENCENRFQKLEKKKFDPFLYKQNVNLWSLKLSERYEFLYNWRKKYLCDLKMGIKEYQDEIELLKHHHGREPDSLKVNILKSAFVIGVTTTGAAKYKSLLRLMNAEIMIVEEAAQVLESHIIASLLPTIQHLILIGDHKQLRPLPSNHELSEIYNLKISMFERLFNNGCPSATLVSQHRMKPCIAELLVQDQLYNELRSYKNVYEYEDILGVKSSVYFLDHSYPESESSSSTSSSNEQEAQMIISLTKYLCKQGYSEGDITILAAYSAQILLIEEYLKEENMNVKITTVDNFQGEENDIILISFVRNNKFGRIGFLMENNRVNVALSRARKGMYCFGNFSLYAEKSVLWKCIVDKLKPEKIGSELPLQCKQHSKITFVNDSEQILELIRRGCREKCGYKLPCGHLCVKKCHYDDADHFQYDCQLPCEKYIAENKKCNRLCFERCKNVKKLNVMLDCGHRARQKKDGSLISTCEEEQQKLLPCTHVDTLACSTDVSTHKCKKLVSVFLSCGHMKDVHCYRKNDLINVICYEMKQILGPCGHIIDIPCHLNLEEHELFSFCKNPCGVLLNCGHPCTGSCFLCSDSGIHSVCAVKCSIMLSCGHKCPGYCGSPCPPCSAKCLLSCSHNVSCINLCSRPCVLCEKNCDRGCRHVGKCDKKCFEMCSIELCSETCKNILPCGHKCAGLCGEPCPYLCRVCNKEDFESGNPDRDFYIELENCNHVVEIRKMDELVQDCLDCLMWPCCPSCNLPIRKSTRYKNLLLTIRKSILAACNNSDEVDEVEYLLNSLCPPDSVIPSEFLNVHEEILYILNTTVKLSSATLMVMKHCIMSVRSLIFINKKLKQIKISKRKMFLQNRFDTILMWICNHLKYASYQQLDELDAQILKLEKQADQEL